MTIKKKIDKFLRIQLMDFYRICKEHNELCDEQIRKKAQQETQKHKSYFITIHYIFLTINII